MSSENIPAMRWGNLRRFLLQRGREWETRQPHKLEIAGTLNPARHIKLFITLLRSWPPLDATGPTGIAVQLV